MDLITIEDARTAGQIENEVSLEGLVKQHRVRYDVTTPLGTVRLRFIGALRRRSIELMIRAADPTWEGRIIDLLSISEMRKQNPDDVGLISKQNAIAASLEAGFYDLFAGCFDSPRMRGGTDVMAFADALGPEDWRLLRVHLITLIAAKPEGEVATAMLQLCARHGVKIAEDLTLENMTAMQLAVLEQVAEAEYSAAREAFKA